MSSLEPDSDDIEGVLYVHLTEDAQIYVLPGWMPEGEWVTAARLHEELKHCRAAGGRVLYSRDNSAGPLSPALRELFDAIIAYDLRVTFAAEAHPETRSRQRGHPTEQRERG